MTTTTPRKMAFVGLPFEMDQQLVDNIRGMWEVGRPLRGTRVINLEEPAQHFVESFSSLPQVGGQQQQEDNMLWVNKLMEDIEPLQLWNYIKKESLRGEEENLLVHPIRSLELANKLKEEGWFIVYQGCGRERKRLNCLEYLKKFMPSQQAQENVPERLLEEFADISLVNYEELPANLWVEVNNPEERESVQYQIMQEYFSNQQQGGGGEPLEGGKKDPTEKDS